MDEILVSSGIGNVDVQVGGPGQTAFKYLSACASMGGPSVPRGDTELRYCQDRTNAGGFVVSSKLRRAADQVTGNLMTKLGKINYLDGLDCPFSLRARYAKCGAREDPTNYDPLMLVFCNVDLTSTDYGDLVAINANDNDEIQITTPWTASYHYRIDQVSGGRLGSASDFGDIAINDWALCDSPQCAGYCGLRKDGCSVLYGVTDKDTTPYAWPSIVQGIKDVNAGTITWDTDPVIGLDGNLESVVCAGSRVIVGSNGESASAYNETYDDNGFLDQDEWNIVAMTYAPAANPNALYARTTLEIWAACATHVGKSVDGGSTWTYTSVGTALVAVYAYDQELVYAVGDNGEMWRSTDGGTSWADITEVATVASNLLDVKVPPGRSQEVYVSTNGGEIYRSQNQGATFSQVEFSGDGIGTIPSMDFCGPCGGDVLWFIQNDGGPRGRILRDISGGNGGTDVFVEAGYTDVISAGVQLNAIVCCNVNEAWAVGEASGGYPAVIKVS